MNPYDPPSTPPERIPPELPDKDEQQNSVITYLAIAGAVIIGGGLLYVLFLG
jgi:hypothetical protein